MSTWKNVCRQAESKLARKHFGDLVPLLDRCAIFEFTDEQIQNAIAYEPPGDAEHPVPPFPFPCMCCVGPDGAIVMQSPTMDKETGLLTYDAIVIGVGDPLVLRARCEIDTTSSARRVELHGLRGITSSMGYFDRETVEQVDHPDLYSVRRRRQDQIEKCRRAASSERDRQRVVEIEEADARIRAAEDEIADLDLETQRLERSVLAAAVDLLAEQFQVGLQEIQWVNKPDHYTVEVGAAMAKTRPKKKGKERIRRMAERERYIVLTKQEIATAWHRSHLGGTHASPMPHLRRGHYRTLMAERYGESRGKRVWVRASHVNGKCVEWRDGDVRYRVV